METQSPVVAKYIKMLPSFWLTNNDSRWLTIMIVIMIKYDYAEQTAIQKRE